MGRACWSPEFGASSVENVLSGRDPLAQITAQEVAVSYSLWVRVPESQLPPNPREKGWGVGLCHRWPHLVILEHGEPSTQGWEKEPSIDCPTLTLSDQNVLGTGCQGLGLGLNQEAPFLWLNANRMQNAAGLPLTPLPPSRQLLRDQRPRVPTVSHTVGMWVVGWLGDGECVLAGAAVTP